MRLGEGGRLGGKEGLRTPKIGGRCTGEKPKAKVAVARKKRSDKAELKSQAMSYIQLGLTSNFAITKGMTLRKLLKFSMPRCFYLQDYIYLVFL